ncbi:MAG: hypothetical protein ACMUEL_08180 [Flavobacteriales bacterium Tduv]
MIVDTSIYSEAFHSKWSAFLRSGKLRRKRSKSKSVKKNKGKKKRLNQE